MKRILLLLFTLSFLSACSGFQHAHYREVKKVSATGFVIPRPAITVRTLTKSIPVVTVILPADKTVKAKINTDTIRIKNYKCGYGWPLSVKKKTGTLLPQKKFLPEKFPFKKPVFHRHGEVKSVLLIVLLLLFGLAMLFLGGGIFVLGFYSLSVAQLLLGLIIFLIGLLPFIGLISFITGSRRKKEMIYEER